MKRSLLGFLVAGLAIVTLAAPTPAEAALCGAAGMGDVMWPTLSYDQWQ
jgi:hypothetical protein